MEATKTLHASTEDRKTLWDGSPPEVIYFVLNNGRKLIKYALKFGERISITKISETVLQS